jgi:4-amino-4-deoxy-L-arabinose transferase-like glycosyltransferase
VYDRFFPPPRELVKTGHVEKWWYYFANFPASIMPWLIAVPAIAHWLWRRRVPRGWNRSALVFLAWVFPVGLLMLSAAGTKRGLYLLPVIAPFGAVAGAWVASVVKDEQPHRIDRYTLMALLGLLMLVAIAAVAGPVLMQFAPGLFATGGVLLRIHKIQSANFLVLQAVGGIFLLVSFYGISLLRRGRPRVAALVAWMAFGLMAAGAPIVYITLDEFKNLHTFTADLEEMNAFSPALVSYRADETTLGIIPYDTGRSLRDFDNLAEINLYLQEHPAGKLLILKKRHDEVLPESLRPRVSLVKRWEFSGHRAYELYELHPPEAPSPKEQ